MKNIIAERIMHKGMVRVTLRFPDDAEPIKITKGFPDPLWSSQMKCWHIQDSTDIITLLLKAFYGTSKRIESFFPEQDDKCGEEVLQPYVQLCHRFWQINKAETTAPASRCFKYGGSKEDSQLIDK